MSAAAPAPSQDIKRKAAREVIDILHEIATLLVRRSPPPSLKPKHAPPLLFTFPPRNRNPVSGDADMTAC